MFLHDIIDFAAGSSPRSTALVSDGRTISFGELEQRIRTVAALLTEVVEPGGVIVLIADNHFDFVTLMYAAPRAGAILAFGNTRHTPRELIDLVDTVDPTLVILDPAQAERLEDNWGEHRKRKLLWSIGGGHDSARMDLTAVADRARRPGTTDRSTGAAADRFGSAPAGGTARPIGARSIGAHLIEEGDCAWLIHTSGTTGRPKGVMLTHRSLVAAVTNTAIARPLADDDVYLFPFPLFHVAAYNVLHAHLRRRPVVLLPRFDATAVLDAIANEHVTCCSLAPTMLAMLLDHPDCTPALLADLRQISYGASSMPLHLLRRATRELPSCGLAQGYGMTELSGNAVFLSPVDHRRAAEGDSELLAAAGRPGPLTTVMIVDEDDREILDGSPGEILVRGDQVCAGYWRDPEASEASRLGPWLRTGDMGRMDDGVLYVVDRKKDLIITGGENVSSREVEDVLSLHPAVSQVAVVGVPDERWGELVCAVVVAAQRMELDPDELMRWTDGRLAGFKRPRRVVVVEQLPLNASGKVDKVQVRSLAVDGTGADSLGDESRDSRLRLRLDGPEGNGERLPDHRGS